MSEYLIISNSQELHYIDVDNILFIRARGSSSDIFLVNDLKKEGKDAMSAMPYMVSKNLAELTEMIDTQTEQSRNNFIRVGKSLIINRRYLTEIHFSRKELKLWVSPEKYYIEGASSDALRKLRDFLVNKKSKQILVESECEDCESEIK